jgi:hypothetical protein
MQTKTAESKKIVEYEIPGLSGVAIYHPWSFVNKDDKNNNWFYPFYGGCGIGGENSDFFKTKEYARKYAIENGLMKLQEYKEKIKTLEKVLQKLGQIDGLENFRVQDK